MCGANNDMASAACLLPPGGRTRRSSQVIRPNQHSAARSHKPAGPSASTPRSDRFLIVVVAVVVVVAFRDH